MTRVTAKDLSRLVERLNRETGNPVEAWQRKDGKLCANIGTFVLDYSYGGVALQRIMSAGGGVTRITDRTTKREMESLIHAYLNGYHWGVFDCIKRKEGI